MTQITGSDTYFTNIVAAATFTPTQWEANIDQAVDMLNNAGHGALDIPNMTGTAGSKTLDVTSAEAGAIRKLAGLLYTTLNITSGASSSSYSIGGISRSQSTSTNMNVSIEDTADKLAGNLIEVESELG